MPDETKATIEDMDVICIRDAYPVHQLFKYVKDDKAIASSSEAGWNTALVKQLIRKAAKAGTLSDSLSIGDWESLQAKIKANDIEFSYGNYEHVKLSHLFVKEYDGTISHLIISEENEVNSTSPDGENADDNFVFKKTGRYKEWRQAVCLFLANVGEGTYHSIRGLGAKIFAHCQISDRLKNTIVDGAMASATILIQPNNEGQREKVRLVRFGPFSVMPNGYSIISERNHSPNLDGLVGVESLIQANLNRNVGMYRPDVVEDEKTPQGQNSMELRNRASKEAKLEKSDIHIYYVQCDWFYNEIFRRVLNPKLTSADPGYEQVKKFKQECIDAGVPKELLKLDQLKVKARRAIGYGSPYMRSLISADILSVSAYFKERGKENAVRDYVHARAGMTGVERYVPSIDTNQIPTTQHTLAGLENNDMMEGADVIVGVDQPHVIHLIVHIPPLIQQAQAFLSGDFQGDPAQLHTYMQTAIGHSAKHLDYLAGDPAHENEYQMYSSQLKDLIKVLSMVEGVVKQQAKQREKEAQQQEEIMRQAAEMAEGKDLQIELQKIQMDFALRAEKERGIQMVREAKAKHGMAIDEMLARGKLATQ